jgi:AcrR family transcriptional regulator
VDPRFRRSRDALRAAVLEAAAVEPVGSLSVADLCRAAGVTRDTFYRHAASPEALLADTLGDEVRAVTEAGQDAEGGVQLAGGFRAAERALLTHVAARATVYRNAMRPVLPALLRANFERVLREALVAHLRRYPETVPPPADARDERDLLILAGYAATGTLGAIEAWLGGEDGHGGELDVDRGVRLILAASPGFWFTATGEHPSI